MPGACLTISDVDQPVDHTPLIVACLRGDLAMVRYLVCEAYVDVNQCSTTRVCRNSCACYPASVDDLTESLLCLLVASWFRMASRR